MGSLLILMFCLGGIGRELHVDREKPIPKIFLGSYFTKKREVRFLVLPLFCELNSNLLNPSALLPLRFEDSHHLLTLTEQLRFESNQSSLCFGR